MRRLIKWEFVYKGEQYGNSIEVNDATTDDSNEFIELVEIMSQNMIESAQELQK